MLVLVCGLPGAGKSTLVRALVEASTSEQVREWVAFDDLFERFGGYASTFNPAEWKKCQIEMVSRVQSRLMHWKETSSRETSVRCRNQVLFVDDNFQYRSQRKRFFHLACQRACRSSVDAAFNTILYQANLTLYFLFPPQSTLVSAFSFSTHRYQLARHEIMIGVLGMPQTSTLVLTSPKTLWLAWWRYSSRQILSECRSRVILVNCRQLSQAM